MKAISEKEIKEYLTTYCYNDSFSIDYDNPNSDPIRVSFYVFVCADGTMECCKNYANKKFVASIPWKLFCKDLEIEDKEVGIIYSRGVKSCIEEFMSKNHYFEVIVNELAIQVNKFLKQCKSPWVVIINYKGMPSTRIDFKNCQKSFKKYHNIKSQLEEEDENVEVMLYCKTTSERID